MRYCVLVLLAWVSDDKMPSRKVKEISHLSTEFLNVLGFVHKFVFI